MSDTTIRVQRAFVLGIGLLLLLQAAGAAEWNVTDAGARGDGVFDNTAIFAQVLEQAGAAGGGIVRVPTGRYRINGTLSIPGGVLLQGTFRVPPTNRHDGPPQFGEYHGSVLLASAGRGEPDGAPFIRLAGNMSSVAGLIIHYPGWQQSDVPPVPYPPCIYGRAYDNMAVLDCLLVNPYEGIRFELAGRHLVRNVYGYPIWRGLYVDECYDIGRVENCHFWPFGVNYKHDDPYCQWVNVHGTAFEFARTDWHYVVNTFCFGYGVGYKFSETRAGSCNGNFLGIGADSCRRAVQVDQCQTMGLLITNGEFVGRWGSTDSVCLEIGERVAGKVSLTNCAFWGPIDRCVWQRGPKSQFTAIGCNFVNWDNASRGSPALQIDAGKAIVQGNTFGGGETHMRIDAAVRSAIVMGNQATGGLRVENHAGRRTILTANEGEPIEWTPEAKSHYRIDVGAEGDAVYLRRWNDREPGYAWDARTDTMRWSRGESELLLPMVPSTKCTVRLDVLVPYNAGTPGAGVYLGDQMLAALVPKGTTEVIEVVLPPVETDPVPLTIRCGGWVPAETGVNANDRRTLGIQVRSVTVRADGATSRCFDANTGEWLSP